MPVCRYGGCGSPQRVANPLIAAWGVIWRSDDVPTEDYVVPHSWLETSTWIGSPFQYVTEHKTLFRKKLENLDPQQDHIILHELVEEGATDFVAMPLEYGDGSIQGMSLVTNAVGGFSSDQVALFDGLRHPLAAAMEPAAMRRLDQKPLKNLFGQWSFGFGCQGRRSARRPVGVEGRRHVL